MAWRKICKSRMFEGLLKWSVSLVLMFALIICVCPIPVSANSPAPSPWYTFIIRNFPRGTRYVDILIQLPESDPNYQELVTENVPKSISADAEIIRFCEDDYRSYTFHYRGAQSVIRLNSYHSVTFFTNGNTIYDESMIWKHREDIEERGKVRIAMLDEQGNILQISQPLSILPSGLFAYSMGSFFYDAERDELIVDSHTNVMAVIIFLVIGLLGMLWTCIVERVVALAFHEIGRYSGLIVATNVVSQLLMRIGQTVILWLLGRFGQDLSFFWLVFVLEAIVYLCEYLFYHRKMQDVSWQRCLMYTVCANTASAATGLLLMSILFF